MGKPGQVITSSAGNLGGNLLPRMTNTFKGTNSRYSFYVLTLCTLTWRDKWTVHGTTEPKASCFLNHDLLGPGPPSLSPRGPGWGWDFPHETKEPWGDGHWPIAFSGGWQLQGSSPLGVFSANSHHKYCDFTPRALGPEHNIECSCRQSKHTFPQDTESQDPR